MTISPARIAAFNILWRIQRDRAYSSVLLAEVQRDLEPRDRSLCHKLVLGVLRHRYYLDALIGELTENRKIDPEVQLALELGLYQLYFLDRVPHYAAVSETVELAAFARKSSAKRFINAILRRAMRQWPTLEFRSEIQRISTETSHPEWLIRKWIKCYGRKRAENIAKASNRPQKIAFRLTAKAFRSGFEPPTGSTAVPAISGCYIVQELNEDILAAEANGLIYFQNPASQVVAAIPQLTRGSRVLDVCAAPGSKATAISARHSEAQIDVFAGDVYFKRLQTLRSSAENQCARRIFLARYDAAQALPFADASFDAVIVDAPCSGTGTLSANPEIRYFLDPDSIDELAAKQLQILRNASKALRPGGQLIYSTCSLEFEEGEDVVDRFLEISGNERFRLLALPVLERFKTKEGFYRIMPDTDEMEGFFIAAFEKR
ncbi:MAG: 16S rRNA (cytosine(967)-C(5))-methyltransferase RsmB [Blastocatellia bacterium]